MTDEMPGTQSERSPMAELLLILIPISMFVALVVLLAMAGNAASATGGCGGG